MYTSFTFNNNSTISQYVQGFNGIKILEIQIQILTLPKAINARSKNNKIPRNKKNAPNPVNARPISI